MKSEKKILLILTILVCYTTTMPVSCTTTNVVQRDTQLIKSVDTLKNQVLHLNEDIVNKSIYDDKIEELNSRVITLTSTVASTKESFYNSSIYLWTFILSAIGLIIVIVGFFGYKSISGKMSELKTTNDNSVTKSEENMKEIKSDLIQRITDNKSDIKDFKADQTKLFEKFEKESKEKIEKGLALDLQNAIDKIMKESFSSELKDLSEQVAALTTRLENISSKEETDTTPLQKENKFNGEKIQSTGIKPTNNAFDEQSK
jgi:hypothetical protein